MANPFVSSLASHKSGANGALLTLHGPLSGKSKWIPSFLHHSETFITILFLALDPIRENNSSNTEKRYIAGGNVKLLGVNA